MRTAPDSTARGERNALLTGVGAGADVFTVERSLNVTPVLAADWAGTAPPASDGDRLGGTQTPGRQRLRAAPVRTPEVSLRDAVKLQKRDRSGPLI